MVNTSSLIVRDSEIEVSSVPWNICDISSILREGKKYIKSLPRRRFSVWERGLLYVHTRWHNQPRIIDKAFSTDDKHNTLERELTVRSKWGKDSYIASDPIIKKLSQLLLRISSSKEKRIFLGEIQEKYAELINRRYKAEEIRPEIELEAKSLYGEYVSWLCFTQEDENLIQEFSWEWKSTFRHCPYYCRCWMIVVCIMQMIDLTKK